MKRYNATEFNREIGRALADVDAGETVLVVSHNQPRAVLLSFDAYLIMANAAGVHEKHAVLREIRKQYGLLVGVDDGNPERNGR